MKLHLMLAVAASLPLTAFADYPEDLDQALARLRQHSSYAWETTIAPAHVATYYSVIDYPNSDSPTGKDTYTEWVPAPIQGVTDRELGTVTMAPTFRRTESNTRLRVVVRENRSLVEIFGGWLTAAEMESRFVASPPRALSPNASQETLRNGPWSLLHTARVQLALRAPADELSWLLAGSNPPMQTGKSIVATLGTATAKQFLHELRHREGPGAPDAMPDSAEGSVTIWLNKGEVVKYEVAIAGALAGRPDSPSRERDRDLKLTKITTLGKFDRAKMSVPAAVLAKLRP